MKTFHELLTELDACEEAIHWARDMTIEQIVEQCPRGDWLLWLASKVKIDHRKLTLAKGHCANTVRHLIKDNSSLNAVDTAIAYGEGKVAYEELAAASADAAAAAAYAAGSAYAAASAAASAAYAAASAAASAADAAYAAAYPSAYADAYAGAAAADAAAYCANHAKNQNRKETADICRKYIGQDIIGKVNELIK